ncbi:MAG: arylsulfotransferase family protein [Candidatus Erginobacter occultus]|nr:arylsulfotransferase family protein [Candidatus Erginobacter occultus]
MKKVKLIPAAAAVILAAAGGFFLGRGLTPEPDRTRIRPQPAATDFEAIRSLPYVGAGSRTAGAGRNGVTAWNRELASPGSNLYLSGHLDGADLLDLAGNRLKRWESPREEVLALLPEKPKRGNLTGLRFAHALPDLGLLAIHDYIALVRLDADSRVLWTFSGEPHHDLWITPGGEIFVLTSREEQIPRLHPKTPILVDYVTVLDRSGKEKRAYSILKMLENSPYSFLLPAVNQIEDDQPLDILHANSIQVFDGSWAGLDPEIYREGNILLSLRNLSFVFIYDPENREIVWGWGPTNLSYQHKARLLDNGRILIFNNGQETSKVVEVDPLTGEIAWEFRGGEEHPFFTRLLGAAQRLSDGNTLVTESEAGTVFEVTPAGEIVWQFVNPGETGGKIAVIPEMHRYPPDYFTVPLPRPGTD